MVEIKSCCIFVSETETNNKQLKLKDMKTMSLIQFVMSIIILICVITCSIYHTILGNISFFGGVIALVFVLLTFGIVKTTYQEYKDERKK